MLEIQTSWLMLRDIESLFHPLESAKINILLLLYSYIIYFSFITLCCYICICNGDLFIFMISSIIIKGLEISSCQTINIILTEKLYCFWVVLASKIGKFYTTYLPCGLLGAQETRFNEIKNSCQYCLLLYTPFLQPTSNLCKFAWTLIN